MASASEAAGGRAREPRQRIASGTAVSMRASTEAYPTVLSIAATSSADGPTCLSTKLLILGHSRVGVDYASPSVVPLQSCLPTRSLCLRGSGEGLAPSAPTGGARPDSPTRV